MPGKAYHVIRREDGTWSVRRTGDTRASRTFAKKSEAVSFAKQAAHAGQSEIAIHRSDGRISEINTYGPDPCPPKDARSTKK